MLLNRPPMSTPRYRVIQDKAILLAFEVKAGKGSGKRRHPSEPRGMFPHFGEANGDGRAGLSNSLLLSGCLVLEKDMGLTFMACATCQSNCP